MDSREEAERIVHRFEYATHGAGAPSAYVSSEVYISERNHLIAVLEAALQVDRANDVLALGTALAQLRGRVIALRAQPTPPKKAALVLSDNPCLMAWPGCKETYNGGHECKREGGHGGRHLCPCGSTSTRRVED